MAKPSTNRMTVNDLPGSIVSSERVMFYESTPDGARLVTDGVVSDARAALLSKTLGWEIELVALVDARADAQQAFPVGNVLGKGREKSIDFAI